MGCILWSTRASVELHASLLQTIFSTLRLKWLKFLISRFVPPFFSIEFGPGINTWAICPIKRSKTRDSIERPRYQRSRSEDPFSSRCGIWVSQNDQKRFRGPNWTIVALICFSFWLNRKWWITVCSLVFVKIHKINRSPRRSERCLPEINVATIALHFVYRTICDFVFHLILSITQNIFQKDGNGVLAVRPDGTQEVFSKNELRIHVSSDIILGLLIS